VSATFPERTPLRPRSLPPQRIPTLPTSCHIACLRTRRASPAFCASCAFSRPSARM
jgi:hypothetical protein